MKYNVTFSCGHEGTVSIVGPSSDRKRKIAWYENNALCPECYKKKMAAEKEAAIQEKAEATQAAAENAAMYGWPGLIGTEGQVNWALVLRQDFYEKYSLDADDEPVPVVDQIIAKVIDASAWIAARNDWKGFIRANKHIASAPSVEEQLAMIGTSTLEPEESRHPGVVSITLSPGKVSAGYQKDEDFRRIVKDLGYIWNSESRHWERKLKEHNGELSHRAAELANRLLSEGFSVQCADPSVRSMAVDASYEPEVKRWILLRISGDRQGSLVASFPRGDEDAYLASRRIPKSRWDAGSVVIPISEYASVLEMASAMHFSVSEAAQNAIAAYTNSISVVVPAAEAQLPADRDVSEILNSSRDVLEDLVD